MPTKKTIKKSPVAETSVKKKPAIKANPVKKATAPKKNTTQLRAKPTEIKEPTKSSEIPEEIIRDPSSSNIFDVFLYREIFMSLRKMLDDLAEKKDKSEKDYEEYDNTVFNITTNAATESGAQDFIGYCYKKGKYDFCLMNFEKYMKWSLLAAANGNAFTLSKLQIFLTNAIDEVLNMENHNYMLDFLELEPQNYYLFISKMICEEMVKNLKISPEILIKMPEAYQEQSEELLRMFDNSKMEAAEKVKGTLKGAIDNLDKLLKEEENREQEAKERIRIRKEREREKETQQEETQNAVENEEIDKKSTETKSTFKKSSSIKKKFRW